MTTPVALYIHVPFCLSVCPYCDFVVFGGSAARGPTNRIADTVEALVTEIRLRAPDRQDSPLQSVYLGGGTPSLLTGGQVSRLLAAVESGFGLAADAEVTLECNPGLRDRGDLAAFREAGANRLSIGAQSLDGEELRRLGRRHSPTDVAAAADEARAAGFDNISVDLLYDIPGQTLGSWRHTVDTALALAPDHLSLYALTLDGTDPASDDHLPVSAGARGWRRRAVAEQDEDLAAGCYALADDALAKAGFDWYEISNWARPGRASRHNLAYWWCEAYEAVGPGAHAFDGDRTRRWNGARLETYLGALSADRLPPGGRETIGAEEAQAERAILSLRTSAGLSEAQAQANPAAVGWGLERRLLRAAPGGGVQFTRRGRLLSNEVFLRLLPEARAA